MGGSGGSGCAELTQAQKEQRTWKDGIDAENWQMCKLAYEQAGVPTLHMDHSHRVPTGSIQDRFNTKSDLTINQCRFVLGEYWVDY